MDTGLNTFYRMPVVDAIQGTTSIEFNKDFIYLNVSVINAISVSNENSNWSIVETTLTGPPPDYRYLTFIVPIQVDDLIKSIYENHKRIINRIGRL
jgi:hypothetical protein